MKINIIGPCASGKTCIAKYIGKKKKIDYISLDNYFLDFKNISKIHVGHHSADEVLEKIGDKLSRKNWILEGIFILEEIMDKCDKIVYVKPKMLTCLKRQWSRYFNESEQRKKFGLVNNVGLSVIIIGQYLSKSEYFMFDKFEYSTVFGIEKKLRLYEGKVVEVNGIENAKKIGML
jgi:adenylate kinase family enzyme